MGQETVLVKFYPVIHLMIWETFTLAPEKFRRKDGRRVVRLPVLTEG